MGNSNSQGSINWETLTKQQREQFLKERNLSLSTNQSLPSSRSQPQLECTLPQSLPGTARSYAGNMISEKNMMLDRSAKNSNKPNHVGMNSLPSNVEHSTLRNIDVNSYASSVDEDGTLHPANRKHIAEKDEEHVELLRDIDPLSCRIPCGDYKMEKQRPHGKLTGPEKSTSSSKEATGPYPKHCEKTMSGASMGNQCAYSSLKLYEKPSDNPHVDPKPFNTSTVNYTGFKKQLSSSNEALPCDVLTKGAINEDASKSTRVNSEKPSEDIHIVPFPKDNCTGPTNTMSLNEASLCHVSNKKISSGASIEIQCTSDSVGASETQSENIYTTADNCSKSEVVDTGLKNPTSSINEAFPCHVLDEESNNKTSEESQCSHISVVSTENPSKDAHFAPNVSHNNDRVTFFSESVEHSENPTCIDSPLDSLNTIEVNENGKTDEFSNVGKDQSAIKNLEKDGEPNVSPNHNANVDSSNMKNCELPTENKNALSSSEMSVPVNVNEIHTVKPHQLSSKNAIEEACCTAEVLVSSAPISEENSEDFVCEGTTNLASTQNVSNLTKENYVDQAQPLSNIESQRLNWITEDIIKCKERIATDMELPRVCNVSQNVVLSLQSAGADFLDNTCHKNLCEDKVKMLVSDRTESCVKNDENANKHLDHVSLSLCSEYANKSMELLNNVNQIIQEVRLQPKDTPECSEINLKEESIEKVDDENNVLPNESESTKTKTVEMLDKISPNSTHSSPAEDKSETKIQPLTNFANLAKESQATSPINYIAAEKHLEKIDSDLSTAPWTEPQVSTGQSETMNIFVPMATIASSSCKTSSQPKNEAQLLQDQPTNPTESFNTIKSQNHQCSNVNVCTKKSAPDSPIILPDVWNTPYTPDTNFVFQPEELYPVSTMSHQNKTRETGAEKPLSHENESSPEKPYIDKPLSSACISNIKGNDNDCCISEEKIFSPQLSCTISLPQGHRQRNVDCINEIQPKGHETILICEKPIHNASRKGPSHVTFKLDEKHEESNNNTNIVEKSESTPKKSQRKPFSAVKQSIMKNRRLDVVPKIHSDPFGTVEILEGPSPKRIMVCTDQHNLNTGTPPVWETDMVGDHGKLNGNYTSNEMKHEIIASGNEHLPHGMNKCDLKDEKNMDSNSGDKVKSCVRSELCKKDLEELNSKLKVENNCQEEETKPSEFSPHSSAVYDEANGNSCENKFVSHPENVIQDKGDVSENEEYLHNSRKTNRVHSSESPLWNCEEKIQKSGEDVLSTIMCPSVCSDFQKMNNLGSHAMKSDAPDHIFKQLQEKENTINDLQNQIKELQAKNSYNRDKEAEERKSAQELAAKLEELRRKMDAAENDKMIIISERDQALEDLRNVETAFSDLHRKYERAKKVLENMKANEEILIQRDEELNIKLTNSEAKLNALKEQAQQKLERMHMDYETKIRDMESENTRLRAQYRKMEMKIRTLENDVEQKARENSQLSTLCDELINGK